MRPDDGTPIDRNVVEISGTVNWLMPPRTTRRGVMSVSWFLKVHTRTLYADGTEDHQFNNIDCIAYGARAQEAVRILKDGCRVLVRGRATKTSDGKGKAKRYKVQVTVDDILELVSRASATIKPAPASNIPESKPAQPATELESGPHADESRAKHREPGEEEPEEAEDYFEENKL
jgi:single-stranded DNA-binding protein